jgi:tRNA 2-selenouridine synthase
MRNQKVIDLEGLAHHKGSAFGALGQNIQPSQEMFENKLADALYHTDTNQKTLWVEDESQRIGLVIIPVEFLKQMRNSVCHFFVIPFEERLQFIMEGYGEFKIQDLIEATLRIEKRLGGLETKNAIQFFNENEIKDAFAILLKYYDKWYEKNALSATKTKLAVQSIPSDKVDADINAQLLEKI